MEKLQKIDPEQNIRALIELMKKKQIDSDLQAIQRVRTAIEKLIKALTEEYKQLEWKAVLTAEFSEQYLAALRTNTKAIKKFYQSYDLKHPVHKKNIGEYIIETYYNDIDDPHHILNIERENLNSIKRLYLKKLKELYKKSYQYALQIEFAKRNLLAERNRLIIDLLESYLNGTQRIKI